MMPRRRYRLFTICALVMLFLFYRVLENSWALSSGTDTAKSPSDPAAQPHADGTKADAKAPEDVLKDSVSGLLGDEQDAEKKLQVDAKPDDKLSDETKQDDAKDDRKEDTLKQETSDSTSSSSSSSKDTTKEDGEAIGKEPPTIPEFHPSGPPIDDHQLDYPAKDKEWLSEHWIKPKEHFPLPPGSIIPIPTGTPKNIPKIQHEFRRESEAAKATRLHRRGRVKNELERAWSGYRKYAWMHDELSPQSNQFRDPFCGWAATLVDSLDTLWIAGMKDEFDEAAKAVANIDFTFTTKADIPVFETTIRYLGGLLAAYDVSGGDNGKYSILLTKATELAEILMGIFDTPNRMPILYYYWRPIFANEPHRASGVGIAELGTLSMEFTRLAQLTGKAKYYDAVDRITNALVQLQKDGETEIPGLFPERLDASGCNRTATKIRDDLSKQAQQQMSSGDLSTPPQGYSPHGGNTLKARAEIPPPGPNTERTETNDDNDSDPIGPPPSKQLSDELAMNSGRTPPLAADGSHSEWDCVPQGLVRPEYGVETYHMGGAQDSAYEYFPKQYLLLGGLEPKYQKLHVDTVEAIDKHLMYRPMIKNSGDWDILFPAKATVQSRQIHTMETAYEVTHLTCFIGGMYGLGGKIFGRPEDVETAKQLTDGCVWAYQSTTSGIMPESAHLAPCPSIEKCKFNQTRWYELLDPAKDQRAEKIAKWEEAEVLRKQAEKERIDDLIEKQSIEKLNAAHSEEAKDSGKDSATKPDQTGDETSDKEAGKPAEQARLPGDLGTESELKPKDITGEKVSNLAKRDGIPMPGIDSALSAPKGETGSELPESLKQKLGMSNRWSDDATAAEKDQAPPLVQTQPQPKPLSHDEWIEARLDREKLPQGYTDIRGRNYILRPEAIESVWYMYRITGDPEWMDKGWQMFEATVKATRTEFANSAIDNVMATSPVIEDKMESFWIAETLKYYYLLFSEPELISLDEWVLNTEAHPFRRPDASPQAKSTSAEK